MKVTIIDFTRDAEEKLIYTKATRLTQGSETRAKIGKMTDEEKAIELAYIAKTVPSSWEFVTYTFEILDVTRAFTHQLVRTRTGSYAQQAQRVNKMEAFTYETGPTIISNPVLRAIYDATMRRIQEGYDALLAKGAAVQDARGVLPTNIHTNIIAQFNLRALSDLVRKRWTARVQDEYRSVVVAMVEEVLKVHPWASDFLIPDKVAIARELENEIKNSSWVVGDEAKFIKCCKLIDLLRKE
jgi:flavin-dependent thymidylate synthase